MSIEKKNSTITESLNTMMNQALTGYSATLIAVEGKRTHVYRPKWFQTNSTLPSPSTCKQAVPVYGIRDTLSRMRKSP